MNSACTFNERVPFYKNRDDSFSMFYNLKTQKER